MTKTLISTITSHWKLYNYILHYMRLDESTYMTKGKVLRTLGKKSPEIFLIFPPGKPCICISKRLRKIQEINKVLAFYVNNPETIEEIK